MHMSLSRSTGSAVPARAMPCTDRTSRSLLTARLCDILGASRIAEMNRESPFLCYYTQCFYVTIRRDE